MTKGNKIIVAKEIEKQEVNTEHEEHHKKHHVAIEIEKQRAYAKHHQEYVEQQHAYAKHHQEYVEQQHAYAKHHQEYVEQLEEHAHMEKGPVMEMLVPQDCNTTMDYHTFPIRALSGDVSDEQIARFFCFSCMIFGIEFAFVGVAALVFPFYCEISRTDVLFMALFYGGFLALLCVIPMGEAPGITKFLLLGALHVVAGMLIPQIDETTLLPFAVSGWFLTHGVLKIAMAKDVRIYILATWPVVLVSGVASVILALMSFFLASKYGTKLLGIAVGADMAFSGVALLSIALMAFLVRGSHLTPKILL